MRTIVIGLASVVLAAGMTAAQDKPAANRNDPAVKAIIANERALYDAVVKGDTRVFHSLVVDEGIWTTDTGFVPVRLLERDLGVFRITRWAAENMRVTMLDENAAIVLYTRTVDGTFGGMPLAPMALASTTWTKRGGTWLAVHHQETDLLR